MQIGFISRNPRGRIATAAAYDHLGISWPGKAGETSLFGGDHGDR